MEYTMSEKTITFAVRAYAATKKNPFGYVQMHLDSVESQDAWESLGVEPGTDLRFTTPKGTTLDFVAGTHSLEHWAKGKAATTKALVGAAQGCDFLELAGEFSVKPSSKAGKTGKLSL